MSGHEDSAEAEAVPQHIGIIVVHGIGEQRRFEHLNWQGREIIRAIAKQNVDLTVEIGTGPVAAFQSEQDTWSTSPSGPVQVFVRKKGGQITHCLHFHEVWWGDVNERYSLAKQLRFWLWGLAIWAYPPGTGAALHGTGAVTSPNVPNQHRTLYRLWQRTRLFMVGVFFLVAAFPAGLGLLLVQRLFDLKTPDLLKILTNYVSGVKLFNQRSRLGPGFSFRPPNVDFLDTLDEPPRVSVRRRMIRTIATVAQAKYDRWYIIAHSQGTVAAFNGLMETPYAWPGYFDKVTWEEFCADGFGGVGNVRNVINGTMPRRPVWAGPNEVAYRARIFRQFRGLLTLGSPLEKFGAIWPARVPISLEPAFRKNTVWINVFDPIDPVSGVLKGYNVNNSDLCPKPIDIGYAAYPVLLLAHLRYTTWTGHGCLADGIAKWLLTEDTNSISSGPGRFPPGSDRAKRRTLVAWAWWLLAFTTLSLAGGWTVRILHAPPPALRDLCSWLWQRQSIWCALGAVSFSILGTMVVGVISRMLLFRGNEDPPANYGAATPISSADPSPPELTPW
jgi:hypothetical protein